MTARARRGSVQRAVAALAAVALAALLGLAIVERPQPAIALHDQVADRLAASGVEHPVTAVLLNFRGYDTFLEIAVLLVAVTTGLAARSVQPDQDRPRYLENELLSAFMHGLVPLMLLVAVYLLWAGAYRPGGAFQGGAVLAAAGVLLRLTGVSLPGAGPVALRLALLGGFTVFLIVAVATLLGGRPFLTYPPAWAGTVILIIETGLTISIGFILLSLFAISPPAATRRLP